MLNKSFKKHKYYIRNKDMAAELKCNINHLYGSEC